MIDNFAFFCIFSFSMKKIDSQKKIKILHHLEVLGYSFPWFKNDENEISRFFTYAIQSGIDMVTKS